MEVSIGEYIRTESGFIEKIKTFDMQTNIFKDNKGKLQKWLGETVFGDPYCEEIVKHSKNIIDLIEVGDIIEHKIEEDIFKDEVWKIENGKIICTDGFENAVTTEDIISIVTKEQFNSIKYEVE